MAVLVVICDVTCISKAISVLETNSLPLEGIPEVGDSPGKPQRLYEGQRHHRKNRAGTAAPFACNPRKRCVARGQLFVPGGPKCWRTCE